MGNLLRDDCAVCAKIWFRRLMSTLPTNFQIMRQFLLLIAIVWVSMGGCKQPPANEPFSFRPDTTKVYHIVKTRVIREDNNYNNKITRDSSYTAMAFSLRVKRIEDSMCYLRLTFGDFEMSRLHVDTRLPAPTVKQIQDDRMKWWDYLLHYVKGQSVNVWVDNHGAVKNVTGVDKVMDYLAKTTGEDRRTINYTLHDFIHADDIKDELNSLFAFIPGRIKLAGQSWVSDVEQVSRAPFKQSNVYVLERMNSDTAVLSVSSILSARQGEQGRVYMKGKLEGNILADYTTGIPYSYYATGESAITTDYYVINRKITESATVTMRPAGSH